jgi:hypothetical protein
MVYIPNQAVYGYLCTADNRQQEITDMATDTDRIRYQVRYRNGDTDVFLSRRSWDTIVESYDWLMARGRGRSYDIIGIDRIN